MENINSPQSYIPTPQISEISEPPISTPDLPTEVPDVPTPSIPSDTSASKTNDISVFINDENTTGEDIISQYRYYETYTLINDIYSMYDEEESANLIDTLTEKITDEVNNGNTTDGQKAMFFEYIVNDESEECKDFIEKFDEETIAQVNKCIEEHEKGMAEITEKAKKKGIPDGEIDNFNQGKIGDCWLLASINALGNNELGKAVLNDAVSETDNGYLVNFKGLNKEVEISKDEIDNAVASGKYSKGDADTVLFELAFGKAGLGMGSLMPSEQSAGSSTDTSSIEGGNFQLFINALTGKTTNTIFNWSMVNTDNMLLNLTMKPFAMTADIIDAPFSKNANDVLDEIQSSDTIVAEVAFNPVMTGEPRYVEDINGEKRLMTYGACHAWSLKSVDNDTVTIINPWDTSKDVILSRDNFLNNVSAIWYTDLSKEGIKYAMPKITAANLP